MIPVLVSTPEKIEGSDWQQAKCDCCETSVSEHKENLERVRGMGGYVICVACAIKLKLSVLGYRMDRSPATAAAEWREHVRRP